MAGSEWICLCPDSTPHSFAASEFCSAFLTGPKTSAGAKCTIPWPASLFTSSRKFFSRLPNKTNALGTDTKIASVSVCQNVLAPVVLSVARVPVGRDERKSKDPEEAFLTILLQGVLLRLCSSQSCFVPYLRVAAAPAVILQLPFSETYELMPRSSTR
jgi:hypothetical protein